MIKITLDTNCIIYYVEKHQECYKALKRIIELGEEGHIDIAVTTRVVADKDQDTNKIRKHKHLEDFSKFPCIGTGGRYDFSRYDSGDFYVGNEYVKKENELIKIIFGEIKGNAKKVHREMCDVDHLMGHIYSQRDIFLTYDNEILKKKDLLEKEFNLTVQEPEEFLKNFGFAGKQ